MSVQKRRNSLLKSSISINSIRSSVANFTEGLVRSRETASEIVKKTNENNKFKRTLIGKDNGFFAKRRENARRRQREDELEASTVQGTTKRQGNVVSRSTKGFLGRILDFFGIVLIGWFVNTLPQILKSIQGLIKRIQGVITTLTNFMDSIGDFLTNIGTGISQAIQQLSSGIDLGLLRRNNEESLESANNNLNKVRRDMLTTGILYNNPANAGLNDYSGEELIASPLDDEKDKKKEDKKPEEQKTTSDKNVEGKEDEKNTKEFGSVDQRSSETKPQKEDDPNNQNLIQGIQDDKEVKQKKSEEAQSQGESIEERDDVNDLDKSGKDTDAGLVSGVKNFMASFFGGEGQQQADKQKTESEDKKDNSSILSGFKANLEKLKNLDIASAATKDKSSLIDPPKKDRNNLKTNKNKNRSQVVIIEKGVPINTPSAPSGGGGGGSSLNSLDGLQDSDAMKRGIKKLQSIILA